MKIIQCDNSYREKWDEFVKTNSLDFGLLQSFQWADFQDALERKTWKVAAVDNHGQIYAVALAVKMPLKFGKSYLYLPRGPIVLENEDKSIASNLFIEIEKIAKSEGAIFTRIEPASEATFLTEGRREAGQVQPKSTIVLNINQSQDDLLAQMKSKTRYNIKVAKKHEIEIDEGEQYFDDFWRLTEMTSSRQEIKSHAKDYYTKLMKVFGESGTIHAVVAKKEGKVIVANLVIHFGDWTVYLHGASDYNYRNTMAPFLLQWQTILSAKENGSIYYDFWGIDEKKWPGVTRFKRGFSPKDGETNYVGAYDEVYSKFWYNVYRFLKIFQR